MTTSELQALVLVGGRGTRLRSVVADVPKPLAEVAGRPFLLHLLDYLARFEIRDVVLCTGYMGEVVRERLGDGAAYGVRLSYSQEPAPLGTGGALRLALPLSRGETVLALNGDSLVDADLAKFLAFHEATRARASMVLSRVEDKARFGTVELGEGDAVAAFSEKDASAKEQGPGWVNGGIYLLHGDVLAAVPAGEKFSLEYDVFPTLVGRGLYGFRSDAGLTDIGTPSSYLRSQERFAGR